MTEHPGLGLSVALRYLVVPALVFGLLTVWCVRLRPGPWPGLRKPDRALWLMIVAFWAAYGILGSLTYLGYRTTIQDLGVYDQRVWALASAPGLPRSEQIIPTFGHFSPVLAIHALLYEIYPSALVLIWTQVLVVGLGAYPVYRLATRHLGPQAALVFAAAYLLYPSVAYTVRFDFHPDHALLPLLLFAFDFLDRGSRWRLVAVSIPMLLIKESLIPTVVAFGAYALVVRRRYVLGATMVLGASAALTFLVVRHYADVFVAGGAGGDSYGYLGGDLVTILRTVALSPGSWVQELIQLSKLKFLFLMLAPLAFLPLLGPLPLIVAVPGLAMSLLSQEPHRYQIWAQYTAPIIPPLVVAAVFGFRRLVANERLTRLLPTVNLRGLLSLWLLGAGLYGSVVFSPSPISRAFWLGTPEWLRWRYHISACFITDRDREIRRAIERYVPSDPTVSVSSQNSLNSSHLAHRFTFFQFPAEADFIVVDLRRPLFLQDRIDVLGFDRHMSAIRQQRKVLYESDGFVIFGPTPPS